MMAAWVRFAKTGRPTGPSLPPWPRYDANSDQLFEFGDELKAGKEIRHNALNTWAEVFRQLR
jgi:carboxylesterase type B